MQLSPDVGIRRATASDATALATFAARTFRESFATDTKPADMDLFLTRTYSPAIQAAEIDNASIATFLAETSGQLAGFCQVRDSQAPECVGRHCGSDARILELGRLYVDEQWHGRGLATALMRAAFANAGERNASHLWLGVFERNVRAQRFYAKCGFSAIGNYVFQVGNDPQSDFILLAPVPAV
jgi:diamine N-acetyltransferase